ncbi:XRE family transcriptional regulator [Candidatus Poribacteria bacterium]|nr:XRE family transcriptional regulator [Candidatus Poribacteria bacterium]MYA57910.1 XRE family transcriptional regulator [Candidatus Poribacteria bacterium]
MSEEIKVTESSGNVFLDIGFSEEEAEYHQLRVDLAFAIHRLLDQLKLTPSKAEARFGLDPSDVSRLKKMDFTDFTVERLLMILKKLNRNVEIHITPSDGTVSHQRVFVT